MSEKRRGINPLVWFLRGLWGALDGLRKAIHLLILLVIALVVVVALTPDRPVVPSNAALVLAPSGQLVDELTGSPVDRVLAAAQGLPAKETLLSDLLEALERAATDDRIEAVVLDLSMLTGGGLSKLQALADAVASLRETGKPVLAWSNQFTQGQYLVAGQASEVSIHPLGAVLIQGLAAYQPYLQRALEHLRIDPNVVVIGEFKSAVEPLMRDDMSEGEREVVRAWLDSLWSSYANSITAARGLAPGALDLYIDGLVAGLEATDGDLASVALQAGLVDSLLHPDEFDDRMRELVASENHSDGAYRQVDHSTYLAAVRAAPAEARRVKRDRKLPRVAVLNATGVIEPGEQGPGGIGSESTRRLIAQAHDDDDVAALVLRVDSPGGSAFASEVIARELERFRATGRPLVVSMSSVAASGGYWIALPADEIWASPETLTGSIGVFSILPSAPRALDALGIGIDGVSTHWLAGEFRFDRPLGEQARRAAELSAGKIYEDFINRVSARRNLSGDALEAVIAGRVFTGAQALESGLVDRLGDLDAAIESAAAKAGLDQWGVDILAPPLEPFQRLIMELVSFGEPGIRAARLLVGSQWRESAAAAPLQAIMRRVEAELRFLGAFGDPRGVAAFCLECVEP